MTPRRTAGALARAIATRLLEGQRIDQPCDLNLLARELGASDVLYRTRIRHGYTEWTSRGPAIQVALSNTDGRRRATLAHECGHLLLDPLFNPASFQAAPVRDRERQVGLTELRLGQLASSVRRAVPSQDLEDMCNRLAVELLLPSRAMSGVVHSVANVEDLRRLARQRRVSLAMLVIRLNHFGGDHTLLQLEKTTLGAWLVSTAVGAPQPWRGRVVCSDPPVAWHRDCVADVVLELSTRGQSVRVPASVSRFSPDRALVLLASSQLANSEPVTRFLRGEAPPSRASAAHGAQG